MPMVIIKAFYTEYIFPDLKSGELFTYDKKWIFSILEDQAIVYSQKPPHLQKSFIPIQKSIFDYNPHTLRFAYMQNSIIYLSKLSPSGEFLVQESNELILKAKQKKHIFGVCMAKDTSDFWAVAKRKKIIIIKGKEIVAQVARPGGIFDASLIDGMAVSSKWLLWVSTGKMFLFDVKRRKLILKAEMALLKSEGLKVSCFIDETLGPMCLTSNHDLFYCGPDGQHPRHRNLWEEFIRVTVERCEKAQEVLASVTNNSQTLRIRVPHLPLSAARAVSSVVHLYDESLMALELHGLSSQTAIEIARGLTLAADNDIQSLSLHGSTIGMKGFEAVAEFLKSDSCCVHTLSLTNSGLSHNSMKPIADALKVNRTVTSLTLSCNDILQLGAESIAEMVKVNTTIQHLDMYGCKLSERGSSAILEALCENSTVSYLEMDRNILATAGELSAAHLIASKTSTLRTLNLSQSRCRCRELLRSLAKNSSLRSLDLSYNIMDEESVNLLCAALKTNQTLQKLNLSHCRLNENAAKRILQAAGNTIQSIRFYVREVGEIQNARARLDDDYT